jgi:hypothetical protein
MKTKEGLNWSGKISNHQQLGGIETSVLNDGNGRGVRVAWINTGSGLRFKLILDRGMDIAEAFFNEHSLTWLSHNSVAPPDPTTSSGMNWLRSFSGGLLNTCGLSHIGGPEKNRYGDFGLHDRINHCVAEIQSIKQPDVFIGDDEFSIMGRMKQSIVFGHHFELKRKISLKLGEPGFHIHDEVANQGNQSIPHMLLYHINFGWPLIDEGTLLNWNGKWNAREPDDFIFQEANDFKTCKVPIERHSGAGESVAFIDMDADENGKCSYEVNNPKLPFRLQVNYNKHQLPCLTNWQHWGMNEYVTALEPGTNFPVGQSQAQKDGNLIFLEPGETRKYDLEFKIITK